MSARISSTLRRCAAAAMMGAAALVISVGVQAHSQGQGHSTLAECKVDPKTGFYIGCETTNNTPPGPRKCRPKLDSCLRQTGA